MAETIFQDTLRLKPNQGNDTLSITIPGKLFKSSVHADTARKTLKIISRAKNTGEQDTSTSCFRNPVADINYRDSSNVVFTIRQNVLQDFPAVFTSINHEMYKQSRSAIASHLKTGDDLPEPVFQNDWFLPVLLFTVLIYGVVRSEIMKFFKDLGKFFSFRGIKELVSRERGSLFQWQATLFNLSSFINISIFLLLAAIWLDIIPSYVNQVKYSAFSFLIVISAATVRHITCLIVGNISEEREVFGEYLFWIYQAYRLASMILLVLSILILYTTAVPLSVLFYTGFVIVATMYLLRITRLFLIFISRHTSILYLILYLCALEIIPVAVIVKYAATIL